MDRGQCSDVCPLQTRLDALTEVDDCGQLTIRCSQDYFSLDCGITAFELSDYSPGDEAEAREPESGGEDASQELRPRPEADEGSGPYDLKLHNTLPELSSTPDSADHKSTLPTTHGEGVKRPLPGASLSTEASPSQPSLPKRAALSSDAVKDSSGDLDTVSPPPGLQFQAELSRSTPSLMDPPDRSKFWLELDSVYPESVSQSCECLQVGPPDA